jgi:hypothetical protein
MGRAQQWIRQSEVDGGGRYRHNMRSGNSEPSAEDPRDAAVLRAEVDQLRAENARLQRLLDLRPAEARPPGSTQTGIFDSAPGAVHNGSSSGRRSRSSALCSPHELMSTPSVGRTPGPAGQAGCPPSGAPALIASLSEVITLYPGDLIFTGTPAGVGQGRQPQRFLRPGETLRTWIEGIGEMRQSFVAHLKEA